MRIVMWDTMDMLVIALESTAQQRHNEPMINMLGGNIGISGSRKAKHASRIKAGLFSKEPLISLSHWSVMLAACLAPLVQTTSRQPWADCCVSMIDWLMSSSICVSQQYSDHVVHIMGSTLTWQIFMYHTHRDYVVGIFNYGLGSSSKMSCFIFLVM